MRALHGDCGRFAAADAKGRYAAPGVALAIGKRKLRNDRLLHPKLLKRGGERGRVNQGRLRTLLNLSDFVFLSRNSRDVERRAVQRSMGRQARPGFLD